VLKPTNKGSPTPNMGHSVNFLLLFEPISLIEQLSGLTAAVESLVNPGTTITMGVESSLEIVPS
jgi:hypothetical protein